MGGVFDLPACFDPLYLTYVRTTDNLKTVVKSICRQGLGGCPMFSFFLPPLGSVVADAYSYKVFYDGSCRTLLPPVKYTSVKD